MELVELKGRDGRTVRAALWPAEPVSEAVLILNGLESNHTWFASTARKLSGLRAAVLALDRRGSGLNQDLQAGLRPWLDDIAVCLDFLRRKYPEARVHLASLCFGAKLATVAALERREIPDSLIFISPGLKTRAGLPRDHKLETVLAGLFSPGRTYPSPVSDDRWFTRRPEGLDFIARDALRRKRIPAREFLIGWRLDLRRSLLGRRARLKVPALVLWAEGDRIVHKDKTRAVLERLWRGKLEAMAYPETDHCLFFEPDISLAEDIKRWTDRVRTRQAVGVLRRFSPVLKPAGRKVLVLETDYERVAEAVERGLDEFPLAWTGRTVLVKPNVIAACPPEKHVTTHPRLVRAVTNSLLSRGAKVIVGDNPGRPGYGRNEECFRTSGILEAVPGHYRNIGLEQERVVLPWAPQLGELTVSRAVLEADLVVSLPKFKTHQLTQITGGLKNCYGYLVGGDKARLHRLGRTPRAFARVLADIYLIRPPDLVIMDAVTGMEGNGPTGPDLRPDIRRLIVADNAVNADTVMAEMMGFDRSAVPLLKEAYRRGLGEPDLEKLDILGSFIRPAHFKKPSTYRRPLKNALMNYLSNRFVFGFLFSRRARLVVDPQLCQSCGSCAEACPAAPKAVVMTEHRGRRLPRFIRRDCRNCYCCMELCPHQAIDKATLGGRRIFKKIF
jgi:uncharacterized protein (DUF362 family)/alpha-beta hydrolase superfamily lysophospholipase/NAD-dependent dihydropyrimidine dehydrogenase PreA subunit